MKRVLLIPILSIFGLACSSLYAVRGPSSVPSVNWESSECKDFLGYTLQHQSEKEGFKTDGIVIQKNGNTLYEFYDGDPKFGGSAETGLYLRDTPHALWSASKTITAMLVARAIHEGVKTPDGNPLSLSTHLNDIFPMDANYAKTPNANFYNDVSIEHLVEMGSNFEWNESYESDIRKSTFLPMLYFKDGNRDMLSYALNSPQRKEGPGKRWSYSGGNSMMLMGVLHKTYGDEAFSKLPWTLLYDPLEISGAVFEKDGKGNFIGNSYAYLKPLDMAKLGQLYLQNGSYQGKQLIDIDWVKSAQTVSPPAMLKDTSIESIKAEGVYSARALWLNQEVQGFGPEFKNSPKDMYFAAGHYGQLIIIIPSENMVIARTGHDEEYWSKIDPFVSKTIACMNQEKK